MKKTTVIRINNDYMSTLAYDDRNEDIAYLVNEELKVHCTASNKKFSNPVEQFQKADRSGENFKHVRTIVARGYSQGDWQEYTLRFNCNEDNQYLKQLVTHLERTFTHQNNYMVDKFERVEIGGKTFDADPHDFEHFYIDHIEFPEEEDVLKAYIDNWGEDFDEFEINID